MTETLLLDEINKQLVTAKSPSGKVLFKQVIKGNVPPPDAIRSYPSVAFYIAESKYADSKTYQTVTSELLIYIYNRHNTTGLNVDDIDSGLIQEVRSIINNKLTDKNILASNVVSSIRDGGSIFPRTVVELTSNIEYVESKGCVT